MAKDREMLPLENSSVKDISLWTTIMSLCLEKLKGLTESFDIEHFYYHKTWLYCKPVCLSPTVPP